MPSSRTTATPALPPGGPGRRRCPGPAASALAQTAHPPRVRPELVASGPDQVWTWDITKLKTQWRGLYFDLYVMLDIFSGKVI